MPEQESSYIPPEEGSEKDEPKKDADSETPKKEVVSPQDVDGLKGQESKEQIQVPKSKTLKHFWNGIINGEYKPLTDGDISKLIETIYLSQPTLTKLTEEEISKIKESLTKSIKINTGREMLKELAEQEIIFLPPLSGDEILKMINSEDKGGWSEKDKRSYPSSQVIEITLDDGEKVKIRVTTSADKKVAQRLEIEEMSFMISSPNFFVGSMDSKYIDSEGWSNKVIPAIRKLGGITMDKKEKLEKFSDIETWERGRYYPSKFGNSFGLQGYRNLYEKEAGQGHSYGYTQESFLALLADIRKRVGKENITMLDVGGGLGTAAFQAQQLDNNLRATNMTLDEEPAMYPVKTVFVPAESMPASFEEKYDLIFSNVAFRYFAYPDIALENCLRALSVGGEARLVVSTNRQHVDIKDYAVRLAREYKRLKELRDGGFIELEIKSGPFGGNPLDFEPTEKNDFPEAYIEIIKLKSLED